MSRALRHGRPNPAPRDQVCQLLERSAFDTYFNLPRSFHTQPEMVAGRGRARARGGKVSQPASPSGIVSDTTASSAVVLSCRGGGSSPSSDPHQTASTPLRRRPQSPARRTTLRASPAPPPLPRLCGAFCNLREERRDADGLFSGLVVPRAHAQVLRALSALSLLAGALAAARGHAGLAPVPLAVGATSLLYWARPDRGSWRRALDIGVLQLGLWYQSARAARVAAASRAGPRRSATRLCTCWATPRMWPCTWAPCGLCGAPRTRPYSEA